ncbi:hypothetical protein MAJ_08509, partial [Metarhizium majus ARSEF 297]
MANSIRVVRFSRICPSIRCNRSGYNLSSRQGSTGTYIPKLAPGLATRPELYSDSLTSSVTKKPKANLHGPNIKMANNTSVQVAGNVAEINFGEEWPPPASQGQDKFQVRPKCAHQSRRPRVRGQRQRRAQQLHFRPPAGHALQENFGHVYVPG